ncbi:ATP-binding protein [Streptomyces lydicamycinicus]|uniref:ATP-binding protein n=1 Tax=Streptomyces lydicamycinicus TaxID=1546107 RepID=UPI00278C4396|nr:ATP-binding protein [Streptomyces lydicamycinicus]
MAEDPDRTPTRQLILGAVASFLVGWILWQLLYANYLGSYWLWPIFVLIPDAWHGTYAFVVAVYAYYAVIIGGLAFFFGRLGHWPEVVRRTRARLRRLNESGEAGPRPTTPPPDADPARWPDVRAAGATGAADRLTDELHAGRLTDVDHARITRAWSATRQPDFVKEVTARGGAAFTHGSGARDLPGRRRAHHDLVTGQVRIGTAVATDRNAVEYRGAGIAVNSEVLGTGALVMGPSDGAARVLQPVVEAACLQALTGRTAVVAVTSAGARLAANECFDAVVRIGTRVGLDLWSGTEDVDVAAAMLAEALVGDLVDALPGGDSRRAAIALAQLIGPWQAVHGALPSVSELRDLLDGGAVLAELREALDTKGMGAHLRELDAHERQARTAGGASALLAERIALLDRPAFAEFFAAPEGSNRRLLSLRTLRRPGVRIRVDLPERAHAEASRILARLVMAQFIECATDRQDQDQDVLALLVLDDAAQTVTPQALRGLQRLAGRAGVVLALRALDDVPEHLRNPLVGAVGCRVVCTGVAPWDAALFAEAWGTAWVETRSVTDRQLVAEEPFTKVMHGLRRLVTGRAVTAQSVTVRREERQRVSPSELTQLPPHHAVISMTTVQGERTPPILTRLEE